MPPTKDRILASAMRLLDTGGLGAVTFRAIGDANGMSQSAPYRYYEDKRALLEAMVRANLDYFDAALQKAKRDAPSPFGALDRLVRGYFDFAWRFPVRYQFLLEVSRDDSPLGAEVREAFGAVRPPLFGPRSRLANSGAATPSRSRRSSSAPLTAWRNWLNTVWSPSRLAKGRSPCPIWRRCCSTCWPVTSARREA
jgi:AcrR family transcriptional regulator